MARIDEPARNQFLNRHDGWVLDEETITKVFVFTDFNEAIGFVTRVAMLAEVADHHPDLDIRWNKVTIAMTTHDEGALTARDTALAERIDGL